MVSGSRLLVEKLRENGVKTIFGVPGGAVLPFLDELYKAGDIEFILARHEQGAAHMADGYARATGRIGVVVATSGPGATNLATGIANAYLDSSPVLSIAGQVATPLIGYDGFQEANVFSMMIGLTKMNFLPRDLNELNSALENAFKIALSGRPGPVHIDVPRDVQLMEGEPDDDFYIYSYTPPSPSDEEILTVSKMLVEAERPVIIAGGGVIISGASSELIALAELLNAPVATTLMGKGSIPEDHPLSLGMVGMHGKLGAIKAVQESDLILAVGMRFSDRTTGKLSGFAPGARKIHVDIDRSEIGKLLKPDLGVAGDAKQVLIRIRETILRLFKKGKAATWGERVKQLKKESEFLYDYDAVPVDPSTAVRVLNDYVKAEDFVTTEVGQCQMYASLHFTAKRPRQFISSGGLGTMGFGLPAAIGVKAAFPESRVFDIAGDGSFFMTCNQLPVSVDYNLPIIVLVLNNYFLGMVRQWQELFYGRRYMAVDLKGRADIARVSEGFGAKGFKVTRISELKNALETALKQDETTVLDVIVAREDNVFPMVPPAAPLDRVIVRR
ncbi:MAG: biosynthetic-type acetolactate synthase large subunit [Thaumarchaeota archaeon]|jgi:acetolactate synthase-1/2/3 large subunit|nr:biosynthetic-type acetolactate synthase large subunit [Nitrososphaerota archaeon]